MRIAALGLIGSALLIGAGVQAQTAASFEVTSIRRNLTANQQGRGLAAPQPGGRFIAIGATLRHLVNGAYGLEAIGGPEWVDTDRFDVNARAEGDRPTVEMQHMLRSLLSERFRLVVTHRDTRGTCVRTHHCAKGSGAGATASRIRCQVRAGRPQLHPGRSRVPARLR